MPDGESPGFERHMGSPCGARQPLAGKPAGSKEESASREQAVALAQALQFADIFVSESNQTLVHLAQGVEEYRNIDLLVLVLVFQRLESAVKKGVFYALYQIWNNAFQPKSKSFFASVREPIDKPDNLANLVNFSFSQIFVNETVADAVDWLRVDANDLLAKVPIAHFSPHRRPNLYSKQRFFRFRQSNITVESECRRSRSSCKLTKDFNLVKFV
jgi:hypothetical protein